MKLLIFCPYYPPHIGGLESHADEFNKYLSQRGMDIVVFTPRLPRDSGEKEVRYSNVQIIRFPAFEIIANYPLPRFWNCHFWHLFFGLFKQKFDIIISRTRFFNTSLLALIYAKIKRVKWIHIEHGSDFVKLNNHFNSILARIYDYTFGKAVLFFSNLVIANSKASAQFCQHLYKNKKYEVIYRGVETEAIQNTIPDEVVKEEYANKLIVTYLGRLIDGKGVTDLLEALSQIKNKGWVCFLIGDGPQRKNLEEQARKLEIEERVIFWGHCSFSKAIGLLKISDIFVNPSYTEGLPTTVIEAALLKKAVIATNVGGTPEIIRDKESGYLIKPKDIEQLNNKLEELINNSQLRKQLGENAYKEVVEKFDWNKTADRYQEIFLKLNLEK